MIVRAITNLQKGLGLGCDLVSLARVGPWDSRGEQRDEDGSIVMVASFISSSYLITHIYLI